MIKIAVLITCHNRKEKTIKCLHALFNQYDIEEVKLKVFLVDDGSTDGTKQAINELFPNVTVIEGTGNLFWARGTSLAWQEALKSKEKFDYYLWLNDDTYLINAAIKELLKTQRNDTAIIVGSVCDPITKREVYGGVKLTNKSLRPFRFEITDITGKPQEIDLMNGNVVLVPHSVCNKIGIIDNFFEHAYADVEYSLRARKNDITILLTATHIAECKKSIFKYETYSNLTFFKKISRIFDRKVQPPKTWFRICYKYGGILWPLHFVIGYIKSIFKIVFEHNYFKKNN